MASRWAWTLFAVTLACAVAQAVLLSAAGVVPFSVEAVDEAYGIVTLATVAGAAVGAAIVTRHPAHRIGWLFCAGEAGVAFGLVAEAAGVAVRRHAVPWPASLGQWATWLGQVFGGSFAFLLLALLFLLVPDGTLPSRRWRWAPALAAVSYALVLAAVVAVGPGAIEAPTADAFPVLAVLVVIAEVGQILAVAAALAALVVRLRRAGGEERQQLRWIVVAAAVLTASLVAALVVGVGRTGSMTPEVVAVDVVLSAGFLGLPVATGFAVLRYRLYDVDVLIGGAVRWAVLVTFVTAGYVAVVVVVGRLAGGEDTPAWVSLLALVVVALAFQPVRRRAAALADRAVHGSRAAPYDALAAFSRALGATASEQDMLPWVARISGDITGADRVVVELPLTGGGVLVRRVPDRDAAPGPTVEVPVRDRGEALGRIQVTLKPGAALGRSQRRLLAEFADRTALVLRTTRLAAELRAREEAVLRANAELVASRRRLVTAGHVERERLASAIGRDVTSAVDVLPGRLAALERMVTGNPDAAVVELGELRARTERALENLRVITRGIFPALLGRRGLVVALEAHADASGGRVRLVADPGSRIRCSAAVEAAAYFCCVEGAGGPADLAITADRHDLTVRVSSSGVLSAEDRVRIVDRVEAVGGRVGEIGPAGLVAVLPLDGPPP